MHELRVDCPVCGVKGQSVVSCRRCKADLSLLVALEKARLGRLDRAEQALREGRLDEAAHAARQAQHLRRDSTAARLLALCQLLRGDYPGACAAHGRG
jgi:hypothetical protein